MRETRTDKFLEFLSSEGWVEVKSDVIPTLDSTETSFQKEEKSLKVTIEFGQKTQVEGNGSFVEELESIFHIYREASVKPKLAFSFTSEDAFKPLDKKIKAFKVLSSERSSLRFMDFFYPLILSVLFLTPISLWIMVRVTGSNARAFAIWEIILIVVLLLLYIGMLYISIQSSAQGLHKEKLYKTALTQSKRLKDIRFLRIAVKAIPLALKKHIYSRVYNQRYDYAYEGSKGGNRVLVGDIENSITRRINGKIGSLVTSERSFILIGQDKVHDTRELENSKEVIVFLKDELQIDISALKDFKLTGKVFESSTIIFFEDVIENPSVKLEIVDFVLKN